MADSTHVFTLHPQNPHYFLFRGEPTILITSGEHYGSVINKDFDYVKYLDTLAKAGLNHTRVFSGVYREFPNSFNIQHNTLGPLPERYVGPYARTSTPGAKDGGNKFDLDCWDEEFFRRLWDFCAQAGKRGVVVEVNLFCPFYEGVHGTRQWELSAWNPVNNINGFGDIPLLEVFTLRHPEMLQRQAALAKKVVECLNPLDNLYFEICNEPYFDSITLAWQEKIAAVITETEDNLPNRHLISQNVANFQKKVEDPIPYVSIFNFHYSRPPKAVTMNYELNKPIGCNETGFDGGEDWVYRTQAWEFILAGGALFNNLDYSFIAGQEDGTMNTSEQMIGGGSAALRRQYRILKDFIYGFDFLKMTPDNGILRDISDADSVYVLAEHGVAYAVYVRTRLRRVALELHIPAGGYTVEWVSPQTGSVEKSESVQHSGGFLRLQSPDFRTDMALRIKRIGTQR